MREQTRPWPLRRERGAHASVWPLASGLLRFRTAPAQASAMLTPQGTSRLCSHHA